MIIYYVITSVGQFACMRQDKLTALHPGYEHFYCLIEDFKGTIYNDEWNG